MLIHEPDLSFTNNNHTTYSGDALYFLKHLPEYDYFDLIFTSPPYNVGKSYESKTTLKDYFDLVLPIISESVKRLKPTGSLCLQVGTYITKDGNRIPLDWLYFNHLFELGLLPQQRIIWHFKHGLHSKNKFDGRHETIMWFTKTNDYKFNLDAVRVPQLYPNKKKNGKPTCNPLGKNPSDAWETDIQGDFIHNIPNVKHNHCEKLAHPCQFPVGLAERCILAMTDADDMVFDPFAGVGSTGVAAVATGRKYLGCELMDEYARTGDLRIQDFSAGLISYRPHFFKIYKPKKI